MLSKVLTLQFKINVNSGAPKYANFKKYTVKSQTVKKTV